MWRADPAIVWLGKMNQWGLSNDSMKADPWDYVHITTLNFLPFLLRRVGQAAGWVVNRGLVCRGGGSDVVMGF